MALKEAAFDATDLRQAGFDADHLNMAGFDLHAQVASIDQFIRRSASSPWRFAAAHVGVVKPCINPSISGRRHPRRAAPRFDLRDLRAQNRFGCTALHWAVYYDAPDAARCLLEQGADADAANAEGQTPVDLASPEAAAALGWASS